MGLVSSAKQYHTLLLGAQSDEVYLRAWLLILSPDVCEMADDWYFRGWKFMTVHIWAFQSTMLSDQNQHPRTVRTQPRGSYHLCQRLPVQISQLTSGLFPGTSTLHSAELRGT